MERDFSQQIVVKDLRQYSQIYLVPLADLHIGCRDVAFDVIQGYLDWIKEHENAFTILNGDLMNCATKDSTPELYDDLVTPDQAYKQVKALLDPIKSKILMITRGGHEEHIYRISGHDYMAQLAYDLGDIPYHPDGGMVAVRLSASNANKNEPPALDHTHLVCIIYSVHGWGGARTIGAKVKKTEDLAMVAEADCYILSHDHTQAVHRLNVLTPAGFRGGSSNPFIKIRRKLLVNTGGFIRYSGYIQRKGFAPQDLGTPRIRIEAKHKQYGGSKTIKYRHEYYLDLHASL